MEAGIIALFIPIVAIIMGIGIGMLKLAFDYRSRREMFQLHHAERLAAIEKGVEVAPLPPEFFQTYRRPPPPRADSSLRTGLVMLLIGGALFVALYKEAGPEHAWWGLLPAAIGAANLIYYLVAVRKLEGTAGQPAAAPDSSAESGPRPGSRP